MTPLKYTPEVLNIIRVNYPKYGPKRCQEILGGGFTVNGVQQAAIKNKIYREKSYEGKGFDVEDFTKVRDPRIAYLLGWLWADGYIPKKKGVPQGINFCVRQDDGREFYEMLKGIGNVTINHRDAEKYNRVYINMFNVSIAKYLVEKDYSLKSKVSPTKILKEIPDHLHSLFWRGFLCGDGSISVGIDAKGVFATTLVFCGSFDQDWSDLEQRCKDLDCKFFIRRYVRQSNGNTGSKFTIGSRHDSLRLLSWIYRSFNTDQLGLKRKFEKFQSIKRHNDQLRGRAKDQIYQMDDNLFFLPFGNVVHSKEVQSFTSFQEAALFHDLVYVISKGIRCYTILPMENYFPFDGYGANDHTEFLRREYGPLVDRAIALINFKPIVKPYKKKS